MATILNTTYNFSTIIHLSDIHIRQSNDRFTEYHECFDRLYDQIQTKSHVQPQAQSLTIITGDVLHEKRLLSQASLDLTYNFLSRLSQLTPVLMIPGNHDLVEQSTQSEDRLSIICQLVQSTNTPTSQPLWYLPKSGAYELGNLLITTTSLGFSDSRFIRHSELTPAPHQTTIALHHGPVYGCKTDRGGTMRDAPFNPSDFEGYDMVLLGDIHRQQQLLPYTSIAYSGSLIQQNFGEDMNHGWLEWDIQTRQPMFNILPNDYGFVTVKIHADTVEMPDIIPPKSHVRYLCDQNVPMERAEQIHNQLLTTSHPNLTSFVLGNMKITGDDPDVVSIPTPNTDYDLGAELLKYLPVELHEIHKQTLASTNVNLKISETKTNYQVEELSWRNILSYPDDWSSIKLTRKISLIVGRNHSGKSNLIRILTYGLFGFPRSKPGQSADSIINRHTPSNIGYINVKFRHGLMRYHIQRSVQATKAGSIKYLKSTLDVQPVSNPVIWNPIIEGSSVQVLDQQLFALIGDLDTFEKTSLFTHREVSPLLDDTPRKACESLINFFRLDKLHELHDWAHGQVQNNKQNMESLDRQVTHQMQQQEELSRQISQTNSNYLNQHLQELQSQWNQSLIEQSTFQVQLKQFWSQIHEQTSNKPNLSSYPNYDKIREQLTNYTPPDFPESECVEYTKQIYHFQETYQVALREAKLSDHPNEDWSSHAKQYLAYVPTVPEDQLHHYRSKILTQFTETELKTAPATPATPATTSITPTTLSLDLPSRPSQSPTRPLTEINQELALIQNQLNSVSSDNLDYHEHQLSQYLVNSDQLTIMVPRVLLESIHTIVKSVKSKTVQNYSQLLSKMTILQREVEVHQIQLLYSQALPQAQAIYQFVSTQLQYYTYQKQGQLYQRLGQLQAQYMASQAQSEKYRLATEYYRLHNQLVNEAEYRVKKEQADRCQEMITYLQTQVTQLEANINQSNEQLRQIQSPLQNMIQQTERNRLAQEQLERIMDQLSQAEVTTDQLRVQFDLWSQYQSLMSKTGIPIKLLETQIDNLQACINQILAKMTNYQIILTLNHKETHTEVNFSVLKHQKHFGKQQLSGYETFILKIALKYALNRVGFLQTSSVLCIDEGLDCIDQHNWARVSDMLNNLTQTYSNIILITHLDAVEDMSAERIKVSLTQGIFSHVTTCSSASTATL